MPDSIMWFSRQPGDITAIGLDDATPVLVSPGPAQWVKLPPELGGLHCKVVAYATHPCPVTKVPCRHLKLDCGVCVAESDQFYWYRPREGSDIQWKPDENLKVNGEVLKASSVEAVYTENVPDYADAKTHGGSLVIEVGKPVEKRVKRNVRHMGA